MNTKTKLMERVRRGQSIEAFTHETAGTFHVTAMREHAIRTNMRVYNADLTPEIVQHLRECRDVDEERIGSLTFAELKEPVMAVQMTDGTHLLIDGTHRILRFHREGLPRFFFWMFEEHEAIRAEEGTEVTEPDHLQWGQRRVVNGKLVPL